MIKSILARLSFNTFMSGRRKALLGVVNAMLSAQFLSGCAPHFRDPAPNTKGYYKHPLQLETMPGSTLPLRAIATVICQGRELRLLIDTGSERTMLSAQSLKRIGVTLIPKQKTVRWNLFGQQTTTVFTFSDAKFSVGPINVFGEATDAVEFPTALSEGDYAIDGILGNDFLCKLQAIIDLGNKTLFLKP